MSFFKTKILLKLKWIQVDLITLSIVLLNLVLINKICFVIGVFLAFWYITIKQCRIHQIIASYLIPIIFFGIWIVVNHQSKIFFSETIDNIFNYSLRNSAIDFVKQNYSKNTSIVLNMILFSFKDNNSYAIYNEFTKLSIVHLIVVSGFHVNIFVIVINKIFFKYKTTKNTFCIIFVFMMCYFNNFNLSIVRSFIYCLLAMGGKINRKDYLFISIIVISLFAPLALKSYGFQMTCLSILVINKLVKTKIAKNKFILSIMITLLVNIMLVPYTILFNNEISIFSLFYSIVFSPIISILYVLSTILFPFVFVSSVTETLVAIFMFLINIANSFNLFIKLPDINNFISISYIFIFFIILHHGGLIKNEINQLFKNNINS